jgi:hypothetical protein
MIIGDLTSEFCSLEDFFKHNESTIKDMVASAKLQYPLKKKKDKDEYYMEIAGIVAVFLLDGLDTVDLNSVPMPSPDLESRLNEIGMYIFIQGCLWHMEDLNMLQSKDREKWELTDFGKQCAERLIDKK